MAIAIDTEFEGAATLTVQAAMRCEDGDLAVQIYHTDSIPAPPADLQFPSQPGGTHRIVLRPSQAFEGTDLTPATLLIHLLDLHDAQSQLLPDGTERLSAPLLTIPNGTWDASRRRWIIPTIHLRIIGHFLPADFARLFCSCFYRSILTSENGQTTPVHLTDHRVLRVRGSREHDQTPIVEFIRFPDGSMYALRLDTFDTNQAFGSMTLAQAAQSFAGIAKSSEGLDITAMRNEFRTNPTKAYQYAAADVRATLLTYEGMCSADQKLWENFELAGAPDRRMKSTLGGRVAVFLSAAQQHEVEASEILLQKSRFRQLQRAGGFAQLSSQVHNRFAEQVPVIHGGLLINRSSHQLFHNAPGQLLDIDITSCYATLMSRTNIYLGRPMVWTPGRSSMTLGAAAELMRTHCPEDGWFIRVTGDVHRLLNALIPSTRGAITTRNYRRSARRTNQNAAPQKFSGKMYAKRIESGVVTHATMQVIELLPPDARHELLNLDVEAMVFYANRLITDNAADYDTLYRRLATDQLPFEQTVDWDTLDRITTERADQDSVVFRFGLGDIVRKLQEQRTTAAQRGGKDSPEALTAKLTINSLYGNLASPHSPTQNVVAATIITARARAIAYLMQLGLNALQTITDGAAYRRDRIPACSLAECLKRQPDYPLRHADENSGIPFLNSNEIPADDDTQFNAWFRDHLRMFFDLSTDFDLDEILPVQFAHKAHGAARRIEFDAMAIDGSANNVKFVIENESFEALDIKMRGYGRQSKQTLTPWITSNYPTGGSYRVPPLTRETTLLRLDTARQQVRNLHQEKRDGNLIALPLGFSADRISLYRALKPSAFVFDNPRQETTVRRNWEKAEARIGMGLEAILLRRPNRRRDYASLSALATTICNFIRGGGTDLTKRLSLTAERLESVRQAVEPTITERNRLKTLAKQQLFASMEQVLHEHNCILMSFSEAAAPLRGR